jgi:hypothetical protein
VGACTRRATQPVISRASLATGGKPFAALALLCALTLSGCDQEDRTPEGAVQLFLKAVESGETEGVYKLLAPRTHQRLEALAKLASAQTGGRRKLKPVDLLVTGMDQVRTKRQAVAVSVVKIEGDRAKVKLVGGDGKQQQHVLELVRVGRRWRIVLPVPAASAK